MAPRTVAPGVYDADPVSGVYDADPVSVGLPRIFPDQACARRRPAENPYPVMLQLIP